MSDDFFGMDEFATETDQADEIAAEREADKAIGEAMTTEILWCQTHDGIVWEGQPGACFKVERDKNLAPLEECEVAEMLLVRKDAPSILLDETITAENWATARATQVRFAPDSMTLPAGRYVLAGEG